MIKRYLQLLPVLLLIGTGLYGQEKQLTLADFENPSKSWEEAGGIVVNPLDGSYDLEKGDGIFVNLPSKKHKGEDIRTRGEYGDFDLSFEYMMFPGSNSGVYMQGRYEIQLLDSWKKQNPTSADNGGIYERWIEEEQSGYEGRAPRQNASRAPGLWQEMNISFQAPKFNAAGEKIANARILSITLNGVEIQNDVELSGPTRGAWGAESAEGPIRIQGDHGRIAFRNMKITTFDNPVPEITEMTYEVYKGLFTEVPDLSTLEPVASGSAEIMTPAVNTVKGPFLLRYTGKLDIKTAGEYDFGAMFNGGAGRLMIDGNEVIAVREWGGDGKASLSAGEHDFELLYGKLYDWAATGLRFATKGPGIRWKSFHDENVNMVTASSQIYVHAPAVHRSFVDIPGGTRLIRAVSVGTEAGIHYTYDMDHGAIVEGWHGDFMNATPMWDNRGDGSARPLGAVTMLDGNNLIVGKGNWGSDTTGTSYRPRGYRLEGPTTPVFMYDVFGGKVSDEIVSAADGGGLNRTIKTEGLGNGYQIRLAHGSSIKEVDKGIYRVDGNYFIRTTGDAAGTIQGMPDGTMVLQVPAQPSFSYQIIF